MQLAVQVRHDLFDLDFDFVLVFVRQGFEALYDDVFDAVEFGLPQGGGDVFAALFFVV